MKLLLGILLLAVSAQFAFAIFGFTGLKRHEKYRLNKEPPIESSVKFADEVDELYIEQRLDHFNLQENRTWPMRYYANRNYLEEGGPIFIYVGGEWEISEGWVRGGHIHDMCRDLSGIIFYTEHRYYGRSRPTEDLTNENIVYLSVDQALADLAHFIVQMKIIHPKVRNSGVILVGASYSATMVTWFMQKYPHLVTGGWSSSAPLEAKVDFVEYKETVSQSLEIVGGSECTARIRKAFVELENLVSEGDTETIQRLFHMCHPFDIESKLDVWSFFSDVAGPFSGIVQYHREGDIEEECELLMNTTGSTDLEALATWWFGDLSNLPENYCYNHLYNYWIEYFNGTTWDSRAARSEFRQWYYQTCSEFGWYQSSGSDDILFGSSFPVDLSIRLCHDIYFGM